ncbi:glycosyltransferase family 2 protein [Saccharopolyspora rosea]|uniref:glycosyltransferase family 2 protein n=1 Tax=Saccharopolyspora rosea TaxID=524884 RepID=UPI0021DAFA1C|nr:glycosyltransferase [Saccharopolyspora rosea]
MRTTVVIATRNRCGELLRTLDRLHRLRPVPPIVVVDNASRDDTPRAVRAAHPDVRLITAPRNLGAIARNLGVLCSRTPYIAFSDDDSWWAPGALRRAEAVLDACPHVALVAAKTLVSQENRPDPVNALMACSPLRTADGLPGPRILGFTACAAVVRRAAFQQTRGFDRTVFFGGEERLLSYDLAAAGWDLVYVDDVVAHHHPSPARTSATTRRALELRNDVLIAWMRRPPDLALSRTGRLARDAVGDAPSRRALAAALCRLPRALARRRRLPSPVEHEVSLLEHAHGHGPGS